MRIHILYIFMYILHMVFSNCCSRLYLLRIYTPILRVICSLMAICNIFAVRLLKLVFPFVICRTWLSLMLECSLVTTYLMLTTSLESMSGVLAWPPPSTHARSLQVHGSNCARREKTCISRLECVIHTNH